MNIQQIFEDNNIKYWNEGKNVSKEHINIQCIFCDDDSNHLGINLKNLNCNCWKCGPKHITTVLKKVLGLTHIQAMDLVRSIEKQPIKRQERVKIITNKEVIFPEGMINTFPKKYIEYLEQRGFNKPNLLIKKYQLKVCRFDCERYKFRIIIPIIMNNQIVSFTSRDITSKNNLKYKTATIEESIIDPKECIFNYDTLKSNKDAFLVEGPFDVMKLGDGAFCLLGVKLTDERINKIIDKLRYKQINNLFIFRDPDKTGKRSSKYNMRILGSLKTIVNKIHIIKSNRNKDPGDLTFDEIVYLKEMIKFNY